MALIFLIILVALINRAESTVVLYPTKNEMNAQDYIDRAAYLVAISRSAEQGGATFTSTNETEAGPFKFHLSFPVPLASQSIHSLTLASIMETNTLIIPSGKRRRLEQQYEWISVDLAGESSTNKFDYYYEISIPSLELIWIKTDLDTKWKFSTVFKFFFNSTENGQNLQNLLVQCPVTLTRPKNVQGGNDFYDIKVTMLFSYHELEFKLDIDASISATLLPCIDSDQTDVATCARITPSDPTPIYSLNNYGKFELFLDNSDFASIYYLIKNKIEMKNNLMPNGVDFTSAATAGAITKGKMTFKLPMAIVGEKVTVAAISTISVTANSRRMMDSSASKATFAASNVGVISGAVEPYIAGISSYILSLMLLFGILLIIL